MADVFVSYKAEDRARIAPLVRALETGGVSVWWDAHIGGGDEWRQTILRHLEAAKCVIVVWSKRSVGPGGNFVRDEASRALKRKSYLPVSIDKVDPPLGFGEMQALDLAGWKGDTSDPRYEAIVTALRSRFGIKAKKVRTSATEPKGVDRRALIAGGSVAAIAIAGGGAWFFARPTAAKSNSIAVMPFENLSGDPSQAYFSDGVAEEIRSALARVAGLEVAGSTSSEAVRNDDAETAAKKLGVANILTGSVRQSPSTIRITAELIDGRNGIDKWSQDYDRNPGDAIKIQTDIAENVANALSAALGRVASAAIAIGATSNPAAQKLYLKAKAQMRSDDSEKSFQIAAGLLDSAIALDPKFAAAYAMKADALANLNGYYAKTGEDWAAGYEEAARVAQQAISLAPSLAAAHIALGYIREGQLNIGGAAAEYERAHVLGGDTNVLVQYALFQSLLGRQDEAIAAAREAQSRDPLNPNAFDAEAAAQLRANRLPQAEAAYRNTLALAPNRLLARAFFGVTLLDAGKAEDAMAQFRQLPPDYIFRLVGESILFARQGNRAASDAALQRAQQLNGDEANYQYACVYAQRGQKELAFAALDRAWQLHDPGLAFAKCDNWLDPLRSDPRLTVLLRKMNFPGA